MFYILNLCLDSWYCAIFNLNCHFESCARRTVTFRLLQNKQGMIGRFPGAPVRLAEQTQFLIWLQ